LERGRERLSEGTSGDILIGANYKGLVLTSIPREIGHRDLAQIDVMMSRIATPSRYQVGLDRAIIWKPRAK